MLKWSASVALDQILQKMKSQEYKFNTVIISSIVSIFIKSHFTYIA